jgi:hypothetical protein
VWRRDRLASLTVQADHVPGVLPAEVVASLAPSIERARAQLPEGYRIEVGGAVEESATSQASVFAVDPAMILIVLTVLMFELESFQRLVIVSSVAPLGLIGVVEALPPSGRPLRFVALLGVLALVGIIKNDLILLSPIEADRGSGKSVYDAVVSACTVRFRPIVSTAISTVLGTIPIAPRRSGGRWPSPSWAASWPLRSSPRSSCPRSTSPGSVARIGAGTSRKRPVASPSPPPEAPSPDPVRQRAYRRLFWGQASALVGTGIATVALALLAYRLVGRDTAAVFGTALAIKTATVTVVTVHLVRTELGGTERMMTAALVAAGAGSDSTLAVFAALALAATAAAGRLWPASEPHAREPVRPMLDPRRPGSRPRARASRRKAG